DPPGRHRRDQRHRRELALVPHDLSRGDQSRLRPHRSRQGLVGNHRAVSPRPQERHAADPNRRRGGDSAPVHGKPPHRVLLRRSRPRLLHDRCHSRARFRGRARHGVHRLGALHRRIAADRYLLQPGRSADSDAMMPFDIVILWTDALIFVLIACIVAAGFYIRSQEHLRTSWRRLVENRTGMAALTVLLVFVAVGFADSLHYRPAPQVGVWSLLDALLRNLKTHTEKTYSAPFAVKLDARETV